jgi:hypothetical protein
MKFNCDPTFESNNLDFYMVFNDAPYAALNGYKFDVKNVQVDTDVPGFGGPKTEITFDLMYKKAIDKNNNFIHWFKDVYSPCGDKLGVAFNPYYAEDAILYMADGNTGKMLRKWTLFKVFPIEYVDEYRDEWNTISFRATPVSVEDLTEEEKKMNDKLELNSILNKVRPYVKLISKLDEVEKYINENKLPSSFESVGKEFVESLHRYNDILKDVCVDIMKDAYK